MKALTVLVCSLMLAGCTAPGQISPAKTATATPIDADELLRNVGINQAKFLAEVTTLALATRSESEVIAETQQQVAEQLKDPGSAQFRNVRVQQHLQGPLKIVCGEINAKNSYGGYVGFRMFAASPAGVYMERRRGRDASADELYNFGLFQACG